MSSKKMRGAILTLGFVTWIGGLVWAFLEGQKNQPALIREVNLTQEQWRTIRETLLTSQTGSSNEQVLKMIGRDIERAGVCFDCNELWERENGSRYVVYPVIGHRVTQGNKRYLLVIGQIGWHAGGDKMHVIPKSAIYVYDNDRMYRIAEEGAFSYAPSKYSTFSRINHPSVEDKMRREAIAALQRPIIERYN